MIYFCYIWVTHAQGYIELKLNSRADFSKFSPCALEISLKANYNLLFLQQFAITSTIQVISSSWCSKRISCVSKGTANAVKSPCSAPFNSNSPELLEFQVSLWSLRSPASPYLLLSLAFRVFLARHLFPLNYKQ